MLPIRQPNPMLAQMLQGMMPMSQGQRGGMMPPQLSPVQPPKMPEDNSLQTGLGMLAMGLRNRPPQAMQQWQPQNQAADLIANGQYADPLLRQAAQWNVPGQGGLLNWVRGMFG